jgi:hypothetical protein
MAGLGINYAADHAEMEADRDQTVRFRGRTIPCIVSIPERSREFEDDATGYYRTAFLRISLRDAVVPNSGSRKIKEGELIEYERANYRIMGVTHDGKSSITLCDCQAESQ